MLVKLTTGREWSDKHKANGFYSRADWCGRNDYTVVRPFHFLKSL